MDGLLLVNKPSGPTSYDIIRIVKRTVRGVKIGHCGTLDPIASGLLILLFGKATKKQSTYMGQDKIYRAQIKLGIKTDSADISGKVIQESPIPILEEETVRSSFRSLLGERDQLPPMYSALKVQGTPLYKLARKGETVERKPRRIRIFSIELLGITPPDEIGVRVHCSSGTYIRTLAEEIGEKLNTVATMSALERETIGSFKVSDALTADQLVRLDISSIENNLQTVS